MTLKDAREIEDCCGPRLERLRKFLDLLCGVDPRPRLQSSFRSTRYLTGVASRCDLNFGQFLTSLDASDLGS
jgi:hypothetical protein